jgi:hypothetical protein
VSTEVRKLIRLGLEAIRSVDSQSGHQDVRLLSALARLFSAQAAKAQDDGEDEQLVTSLYLRASHYWSCAKPALENIKTGRSVRLSSQDRFFHLSGYVYFHLALWFINVRYLQKRVGPRFCRVSALRGVLLGRNAAGAQQ